MNSKKDKIIHEIKRIAGNLGKDYISQREFESNSQIKEWKQSSELINLNKIINLSKPKLDY